MKFDKCVKTLLAAFCLASSVQSAEQSGIVVNGAGEVVANARVDIATAAPKSGFSEICPSCYLDCSKNAVTGPDGTFKFEDLDDSLKFRYVVSANGFITYQTDYLEPSQKALEITIGEFPNDLKESQLLSGTVKTPEGVPIQGALIEVGSITTSNNLASVPTLTTSLSDASGRFLLPLVEDIQKANLNVYSDGYAPVSLWGVVTGVPHEVILRPGCTIKGQVDLSLVGSLEIVQIEDTILKHPFVKRVQAKPWGINGNSTISDLPPNEYYAIYSRLDGSKKEALVTSTFRSSDAADILDLGSLRTSKGNSLRGKIRSDSDLDLAKAELYLKRRPAWEVVSIPLEDDLSFEVKALPPESYDLLVKLDDATIDFNDLKFQSTSASSFLITVEKDQFVEIPLKRNPIDSNVKSTGVRKLKGVARDRKGNPIAGLRVRPIDGSLSRKLSDAVETNGSGAFSFENLPETSFQLFYYFSDSYKFPRSDPNASSAILFSGLREVDRGVEQIELTAERMRPIPLIIPR